MKLTDKLESVECRRDDKARRVSNVAPDTIANIDAETLEKGVTLESLENLNVPVLRYSTQVTVHGKLPSFNPSARPGGYKAIFQNQNGSIGVRYSAIDACKKALLVRASKVAKNGWVTVSNSTGFEIQKSFYVHDEDNRAAQKAAVLAALKAIPVSRFYGSAYAFTLMYGAGYGVGADIGAIPVNEVWPLINDIWGISSEAELVAREEAKAKEEEAKHAEWEAQYAKERAEKKAALEAQKASLASFKLASQPVTPGSKFRIMNDFNGELVTVELSGTPSRVFYSVIERNGIKEISPKRKELGNGWKKAAAEGRLFACEGEPVAQITIEKEANKEAPIYKAQNPSTPATPRQTFALFCACGKDFRKVGLTYNQASQLIASVQDLRKDKVAALKKVEEGMQSFGFMTQTV